MRGKSNKLSLMGRRRFMDTLAKLGMSGGVAANISKEELKELTDDPTDRVPRVEYYNLSNAEEYNNPPFPDRPGERVANYYTIPRDKWIVVETAFDAAERIQKKIDAIEDSKLISSSVDVNGRGKNEEYSVVVNYDISVPGSIDGEKDMDPSEIDEIKTLDGVRSPDIDLSEIMRKVPETTEGSIGHESVENASRDDIPVRFESNIVANDACSDEDCHNTDGSDERFYEESYDYGYSLRGTGCSISIEESGWFGYSSSGSLGPRIQRDSEEDVGFLTNGHITYDTDDESSSDGEGRSVYQYDDDKIGEVGEIKHDGDWDIAFIEMEDGVNAGSQLSDIGGGFSGALGSEIVGEDWLKDQEYTGNICQQGRRTGRCEHSVGQINDNVTPMRIELIRANDQEDGDGDSGGPYFYNDGDIDNMRVVGLHRASLTQGTHPRSVGNYIGDIEEEMDYTIV
ncbi:uncharacterized protein Nmag_0857 [Natrialba magadii ATCC 43099]|uniref:Uncharacterized protein n=1 Tax=Natrialba magadii (strain ATCC 43099 / DSM 3394 / CCM 3739 / CIP 104546 / IAM 13178 / JCM 8861 / NBRC 102185 / NCIMB 2190 / MS3) TaxID=547559 RepID=D3T083_NATMM|nr:hypothetical protein [Natrialba magadii]ADD04441.1 uncharacterized protein Nmag_0857 [Natrialba magadii ATCC 43099]